MGNLELSFRSWFSSACERSAEGILFVSLKAWISFFEDLEPHDPLRSAQLREAGGEAALQRAFEDARRKQAGDCPGLCFASFLHALAGLNQALDLRWSPVLDFFQENHCGTRPPKRQATPQSITSVAVLQHAYENALRRLR